MVKGFMAAILTFAVSIGVLGLVQITAVSALSDKPGNVSVPGNNATLKVHEFNDPKGTESNDPKVCSFNFEGFNFDEGQDGYIMIETQGGSDPIGEDAGPFSAGPADAEGFFETMYFNDADGPVIKNGTYKATMYGKDLPSGDIDLEDEKAKSKVFKVECEEEDVTSDYTVLLPCVANKYRLSVANTGNSTLSVFINGTTTPLAKGSPALIADFEAGDTLTVKVDGTVVEIEGKILNNFTLQTCKGMGGVTGTSGNPTTPILNSGSGATVGDVTSLPVTSGAGDKAAALVVMIGSILATAGGYALRARSGELSI